MSRCCVMCLFINFFRVVKNHFILLIICRIIYTERIIASLSCISMNAFRSITFPFIKSTNQGIYPVIATKIKTADKVNTCIFLDASLFLIITLYYFQCSEIWKIINNESITIEIL